MLYYICRFKYENIKMYILSVLLGLSLSSCRDFVPVLVFKKVGFFMKFTWTGL